jgi:hypothetical protein
VEDDMTTVEIADATRADVDRVKTALREHGLTAERLEAATERIANAAERGSSRIIERVEESARERSRRRLAPVERRLPRGVTIGLRAVGLAWGGLMLSTFAMATASRMSSRRVAAVDPEADEIRLRADLGPLAYTSRAKAFRGGSVDCWYGGGFVDLREATLDPSGAHLRVRAVFGGGQIAVPDGWRVVRNVRGIGGMADLRPKVERPEDAPVLTVDGVALFGGFSIESTIAPKTRADLEEAVGKMGGVDGGPAIEEERANGHDATVPFAETGMDVLVPV